MVISCSLTSADGTAEATADSVDVTVPAVVVVVVVDGCGVTVVIAGLTATVGGGSVDSVSISFVRSKSRSIVVGVFGVRMVTKGTFGSLGVVVSTGLESGDVV